MGLLCFSVGGGPLSDRQVADDSKLNFGNTHFSDDIDDKFVPGTPLFEIDPGNKSTEHWLDHTQLSQPQKHMISLNYIKL